MTNPLYPQYKLKINQLFSSLTQLAQQRQEIDLARFLQESHINFAEGKLYVVVCGEFKQGKSKLLNAFLDQKVELLPVDVDITTRLVCKIEYGLQEKLTVYIGELDNLRFKPINRSEIRNYVTEQGNPNNVQNAQMLSIQLPNENLNGGLVLVDTPGLDSLFEDHTVVTRSFLPRADVILFVSDVLVPLTAKELKTIKELAQRCRRIMFVLTKIDAKHNYVSVVTDTREKLSHTLNMTSSEIVIVPVSSNNKLDYLESKSIEDLEDSNFEQLEQVVWQLLGEEHGATLLLAALDKLERAISELKLPIQTELSALQETSKSKLLELEKKLQEERAHLQALLENQEQWRKDLQRGIANVKKGINREFEDGFRSILRNAQSALSSDKQLENAWQIVSRVGTEVDDLMVEMEDSIQEYAGKIHQFLKESTDLPLGSISVSSLNWERREISLPSLPDGDGHQNDPPPSQTGVSWQRKGLQVIRGATSWIPFVGGVISSAITIREQSILERQKKEEQARLEMRRDFERERATAMNRIRETIRNFIQDCETSCRRSLEDSLIGVEQAISDDFQKQITLRKKAFDKAIQALQGQGQLTQQEVKQKIGGLEQDFRLLIGFEQEVISLGTTIADQAEKVSAQSNAQSRRHKQSKDNENSSVQDAEESKHTDNGEWADV